DLLFDDPAYFRRADLHANPPLVAFLDLLFHFLELRAHAAVVDFAFELDDHSADERRIAFLPDNDLLAGYFFQRLAQPLEIALVERVRGGDARLRLALLLVEHSPVVLGDAEKIAQPVIIDEQLEKMRREQGQFELARDLDDDVFPAARRKGGV